MALGRDYQAPQIGVQNTEQALSGQISQADTRVLPTVHIGDSQWMSRLVENLGGKAEGTLDNMADIARQNLYLKGQADVGMVKSSDEIQGNPMTRDWEVAGYNDTMGKMKLAQQQADLQVDMQQLRQQGTDDFQKYLDKRRDDFSPQLQGMSLPARAAAAGQMLVADKAAISQWTGEHQKFIIDTKSQAISTAWNTSISSLSNAQMQAATGQISQDDFQSQIQQSVATLVGGVWADSTLPVDVKRKLTSDAAAQALSTNNMPLYDFMNHQPIADGQGGNSTLIGRLNGDQQLTLANSYRDAYQRTNDQRSLFRMSQIANVTAQIDANQYTGTYKELDDLLTPMVMNQTIPGTRRESILNSYLDKQYKNQLNSDLSSAMLRGDYNFVAGKNKSLADGVAALDYTMSKNNVDPMQRLSTWLTVGNNGISQGYSKAGEQLGVTINQIANSTDGKVLPQHIQVFGAINAAVRNAEAKGDNTVRANMLSGLQEKDRMFMSQVFSGVDAGQSLDEALQHARTGAAEDAKLTPAIRSATAAKQATDIGNKIDTLDSRGLFASGWLHTKAFFGSSDAAQQLKLRPLDTVGSTDGWMSSSPTVQFYSDASRASLREEASAVSTQRPGATADQVLQVAQANLAARTIDTQSGPLIMPRNVNLQQVFGVSPSNQSAIGPAIDSMLKTVSPSGRFQLSFANGQLYAQEVDANGARVGNGRYISGDSVKSAIQQHMGGDAKLANEQYGTGKLVNSGGLDIAYTGQNTAGASNDWMMGFRDNLVSHEGVRDTAYNDLSGKVVDGKPVQTVGVGVSSHSPFWPRPDANGKITSEQASGSFMAASDDAAKAGMRLASTLGVHNGPGFGLLSELAYQSGTNFMGQSGSVGDAYRKLGSAIGRGNFEDAQSALVDTPAWRMSGGNRHTAYLSMLQQAIKLKGQ